MKTKDLLLVGAVAVVLYLLFRISQQLQNLQPQTSVTPTISTPEVIDYAAYYNKLVS